MEKVSAKKSTELAAHKDIILFNQLNIREYNYFYYIII